MRGPPLSYIPRRRTHLKYAAPWTYERVGRYSHSYITSYKLNFSSSPLFNLSQYFSSNIFLKSSQSQKCLWGFSRHPFLRTIFGWRFFASLFLIGEMETQVRIWPSPWTIRMRTRGFSADVGCIFVNVKFPRCIHLVYFTAEENVS